MMRIGLARANFRLSNLRSVCDWGRLVGCPLRLGMSTKSVGRHNSRRFYKVTGSARREIANHRTARGQRRREGCSLLEQRIGGGRFSYRYHFVRAKDCGGRGIPFAGAPLRGAERSGARWPRKQMRSKADEQGRPRFVWTNCCVTANFLQSLPRRLATH